MAADDDKEIVRPVEQTEESLLARIFDRIIVLGREMDAVYVYETVAVRVSLLPLGHHIEDAQIAVLCIAYTVCVECDVGFIRSHGSLFFSFFILYKYTKKVLRVYKFI